jgi:hypothetical protein
MIGRDISLIMISRLTGPPLFLLALIEVSLLLASMIAF